MTERELLARLCAFIVKKEIVVGDEKSIKHMCLSYQNPPMSLIYPVIMRMTVKDVDQLNELLKQAHELLSETEPVKEGV